MILDRHKLKFSGNLLIEKVNVSVFVCVFLFSQFILLIRLFLSQIIQNDSIEISFFFLVKFVQSMNKKLIEIDWNSPYKYGAANLMP